MSKIIEIVQSFNCLFLEGYSVIPIPNYKDDKNNKFVKSYNDEKISVSKFTVALLNKYICKKKNVDDLKLWKVNVKKSEIKDKNVSTEEDIVQKLYGKEMEPEKLFEEYFQDELNNQNFKVSNIHVIAIIPITAPVSATGDLRKTFPHVDDVEEPFFRKLAQKLAVIWKRSHDFSLETPNYPYYKLNQSPSILKTRLPYGVTKTTCNEIDPRLPPFKVNTKSKMIYENPLYYDPQFQETVNLVRERIKENGQDVIVLAGVSGGGKTSITFAIAAEQWGIHVDCSHIISDYNNQLSRELGEIKAKNPPFEKVEQQNWALRSLDIAFASRLLILVKMFVEKKIKTPKDWLLAQLHGLDKPSIALLSENLTEQSATEFSTLLIFINKCLKIERILFIQDEAQCLCRPEFGDYVGNSIAGTPWNLLQAYTHHMISSDYDVTHIISGTTMHMLSGIALVTSVGKIKPSRRVHLVLKLPYLSPDDVIRILKTVINMDGVSFETLSYLGNFLKGRPRNCVLFIKMLTDLSEPLKDKDNGMVNTSKKWFKEITNTMVEYLRNTASTLSLRGINPTNAIIEIICCRILNSESPGAELLRHGILPVKSPPFITLLPHNVNSSSFKINLELESYIIESIEKYLKLNNKETLTDIYVTHILQRLGSKQAIGSELDAAFVSTIIEKRNCSVLEELKKWTGDTNSSDFNFPEWITPGMQFVTETNLSNNVSLYDYVKDIYESTRYHNAAIQPTIHAGSDLVLSLVDESNESKNVVLLSLSSAFYEDAVPANKVRKQALKVCMEFQYMTENQEMIKGNQEMIKRRRLNNKSEPQNKKMKMDYCEDGGKERSVDVGLTEKFRKEMKQDFYDQDYGEEVELQEKSNEALLANIGDDDCDDLRRNKDINYDLDYDRNLKYYQVSQTSEHAELHHKIAKLMTVNKISSNAADKRKCIHVLVELPHRASSRRPDIFRCDKKGNLIVIIDDRNVKQVFGEKLANVLMKKS
ncbi:hypothetical protein GLOIN_2v1672762 [Rhizophagus clarus]|uniref:Uncharacterized protein n=1 Tax=Rhizophagus clarus TaxID=94130 RepID=A0A8H3L7K8_9GLOM|nr:hypothetical protein GLOIN_2v1672762 [Rhizophagus clarus]